MVPRDPKSNEIETKLKSNQIETQPQIKLAVTSSRSSGMPLAAQDGKEKKNEKQNVFTVVRG
jgi:hypothetical protein